MGCCWESLLFARGWNDLPGEKKVGKIIEAYELTGPCGGGYVFEIEFDGCGVVVHGVFPDEIRPLEFGSVFRIGKDKETRQARLFIVSGLRKKDEIF